MITHEEVYNLLERELDRVEARINKMDEKINQLSQMLPPIDTQTSNIKGGDSVKQ